MPVSGKFVWASSSLFFLFPSFFPVWSVAMLHKWDLILLPWLQSFPGALKRKQQGCWHALYRKTQLFHTDFKYLTSPVTFPLVLVSLGIHDPAKLLWQIPVSFLCWGHRCCKAAAGNTAILAFIRVTSSSMVKATKRQGFSEEMREQPIAVWMHIIGRKGNIALNSFANLCG